MRRGFGLCELADLMEKDIFRRIQIDDEFVAKHGGDPDCFPSTFDFVIALCLDPELSYLYLYIANPKMICFAVMMLDDLLFSRRFKNRKIIDTLNDYVALNKDLFTPSDYDYVTDILSDYISVNDDDVFEKGYLAYYVDLDKCIAEVFSEN